jgi:hypothetical protein
LDICYTIAKKKRQYKLPIPLAETYAPQEEKMKSSKPPAVAIWMLEHLQLGNKNLALEGDLLEQFHQGRSAAWYWRQVLAALFTSFLGQMRVLWVAAGFTMVWTVVLNASSQWLLHASRSHLFSLVFGWGVTLAWPVSEIYAITFFAALTAVPLLISLSLYLGVMRSFNLRRLLQGLVIGMIGFAFGYVGLMLLPAPLRALSGTFEGHVLASLPLFFALLLSIWVSRPNTTGGATAAKVLSD